MTISEHDKQEIKRRTTEYLTPAKKKNTYICPACGSGTGKKGTGMTSEDNGEHFKCWNCGFSGDIFDIIAVAEGISLSEAFKRATEIFSIEPESSAFSPTVKREVAPKEENKEAVEEEPDFTEFLLQAKTALKESQEALTYILKRGISIEVANRFNVGYDSQWVNPAKPTAPKSKRLIIPTNKKSYLARAIDDNGAYSKLKAGKAHYLFNKKALYNELNKPVFVAEGELDALSIIEVCSEAIALRSTGNYMSLVNQLKEKPTQNTLIICLDNDKAGQETAEKLTKKLDDLNVKYLVHNISGECKDVNEAFVTDKELFSLQVRELENKIIAERQAIEQMKSEKYREENSTASHIGAFLNNIQANKNTPAISTGFKELDNLLDGGLYAGLYILGAISSLGKTTFVLQIGDNIAQNQQDVLIFSLEMAKYELMAKSISRITYEKSKDKPYNAKTTRGLLAGRKYENYSSKEIQLIRQATECYETYAKYLFIHEAIGDIGAIQVREHVEKHINATKSKPVVIIDYLQILAPFDMRASDKQNTDKAVFELKKMSRDYNIPVIAISSFNRENYSTPVNMTCFKESGAVEYSSDVLIGLQFEGMEYDEKDVEKRVREKRIRDLYKDMQEKAKQGKPQEIECKILKQRNGVKGVVSFDFKPRFNYFVETNKNDSIIPTGATKGRG